jgi:hypothetical protein
MAQERDMGEWKTVYADEVEGRWVTLRTYESEDAEDGMMGTFHWLGPHVIYLAFR